MYKITHFRKTQISRPRLLEGEPIELKVTRLIQNKEPIKDGAPLIYTEKKDGINAAYNIRTDRWEIAAEAMNKILASKQAKKDALLKSQDNDKPEGKVIKMEDGKPESTAGKAESK